MASRRLLATWLLNVSIVIALATITSGSAHAQPPATATPAATPAPPTPGSDQVIVTPAGAGGPGEAGATPILPPPAPATPLPPPPAAPEAAKAPEENAPAGWVKGTGFVIQSPDTAFRLRIGLQAAYKFEPVYQNGNWPDRNTFYVLRPILSGNFFKPWIHFWTSMEWISNPPYMLDSYIEIQPWTEFGLRIGQQFTPFDRHEYLGPQEILFPTWAPVSEYFWTGRDKGITAMGALADTKFEYWAGLYSGTPLREYSAVHGNYVVEGRVTVSPLGPAGTLEFPYILTTYFLS